MKNALVPTPMPPFMQGTFAMLTTQVPPALNLPTAQFPKLIERIADTGAFAGSKHKLPNHVRYLTSVRFLIMYSLNTVHFHQE